VPKSKKKTRDVVLGKGEKKVRGMVQGKMASTPNTNRKITKKKGIKGEKRA